MSLLTYFTLMAGVMSARMQRNRRRLGRQIGVLVGLFVLPLAGLAFYFLSTGLNAGIARTGRERDGLRQVRPILELLPRVVALSWSEEGNDASTMGVLEEVLAAVEGMQTAVLASPSGSGIAFSDASGAAPTPEEIRAAWRQPATTGRAAAQRQETLQHLVAQFHRALSHASDEAGLNLSPEAETNAMADVVSYLIPAHVERLLHMHALLAADLRSGAWDDATRSAAAVFARQLKKDDAGRLAHRVAIAIAADRRSGTVVAAFQRDFTRQAREFVAGLRQLAADIGGSTTDAVRGKLPAAQFDRRVRSEIDAVFGFWGGAVDHLDGLLADQAAHARWQRDRALLAAAGFILLLVPVAWLYFRSFIRPVVQDMVDESLEQQKAAEEARAAADESLRRLRQTQAALDDHCAVLVTDTMHRILAVNDRLCRSTGYSREELLRDSPSLFDRTAHPAGYLENLRSVLAGGQIWHGNICQRARDGRAYWVDATVFPICDAGGRPMEFVSIQTDITELVRARESAEGAARAKSQFLAMMSHEIRTPMNGVIGFANLLAETRLDEQQRDHVRTILTSGESLLTIINDILDFSKLDSGRTELESRPVALRLLVEDVLELLATQARAKNIELVYWIEPDVPEGIMGDETRLRQVLLNLAGNAVKFTPVGHVEIAIGCAAAGANGQLALCFHVRDTGIGIPAERQDRLFKAFSQVDASITRSFGGTGLGLAISQRLVSLMGGKIEVTSAPGRGSDFHFTLSVAAADVSSQLQERTTLAPNEIASALRGRRLLVVDDLPANLRLIARILEQYGAGMLAARSAAEALAAAERHRFDLAVLDFMMPGMDGIALGGALRAQSNGRHLPLILVTSAQLGSAELPDGLFAGVVPKPLRNQQFAATMAQALLGPAAPRARAAPARTSSGFASAHPLRVLVVDDNAVNLKVITATLGSLGYTPAAFSGAAEALERLGREKFDLVLTDVQMPEIDGHEVTRRLRAGAAGELNRHTRVVALTAGALAEERAACLAAGMDDFIAKPVPREQLMEKLAEAARLASA